MENFDLFNGWVLRAGHKLEAAIEQLEVDVTGKVALDSGLSTGGFTDCLLQYGASFVYGVDVGYGQVWLNLCSCVVSLNSSLLIMKVTGFTLGGRKNPPGWTRMHNRANKFKISFRTSSEGWFSDFGPFFYFHTIGKISHSSEGWFSSAVILLSTT